MGEDPARPGVGRRARPHPPDRHARRRRGDGASRLRGSSERAPAPRVVPRHGVARPRPRVRVSLSREQGRRVHLRRRADHPGPRVRGIRRDRQLAAVRERARARTVAHGLPADHHGAARGPRGRGGARAHRRDGAGPRERVLGDARAPGRRRQLGDGVHGGPPGGRPARPGAARGRPGAQDHPGGRGHHRPGAAGRGHPRARARLRARPLRPAADGGAHRRAADAVARQGAADVRPLRPRDRPTLREPGRARAVDRRAPRTSRT